MAHQILHYTDSHPQDTDLPVLVIMHGLFGSQDNWNQIASPLKQQYRVIQLDLRNHGRSFHSSEMNYQVMAEDLLVLANHLKLHRFHLMGHSMGGKVAMEFSQAHPNRILSLIVVDIAPRQYPERHTDVFLGLNAVPLSDLSSRQEALEHLSRHIKEPMVTQFMLKGLFRDQGRFNWRFNLKALQQQYPNLIANISDGPGFDGPVMFLKGMKSDYIERQDQPVIQRLFPNAEAKVVADTGHWLHAEKPRLVLHHVEKFLTSTA